MCDKDCIKKAAEEKRVLIARTDAIIDRIGTTRDIIIPLLQALQAEFNYLRSDVLERVYERTEIDRAQLMSVSTFYSQFRLMPYGKHVIKVCVGTACHVKGADNVYDSMRRELKMKEDRITTDDGEFSIEKVACLGCCALAPVVQIDQKIYGHVQPGRVMEVIDAFKAYADQKEKEANGGDETEVQGEIRLGMENCCQASGTADIYKAVMEAKKELGINVRIKPVSCVGACNQVPLIDLALPDGTIKRYPNVNPEDVREILLHHFEPQNRLLRLRNKLFRHIDHFQTDEIWNSSVWTADEHRTRTINNFFAGQKRVSTEGYGLMSPLDIDEYLHRGGFKALEKALKEMTQKDIIDEILNSGLRGRGGGGFPSGRKWDMVAQQTNPEKYIICNGDEGDPGAFMDRILLESYPLRVIEGMVIAGYAVGAHHGIFYIRAEYPQAVIRTRKALEMCRERNLVGKDIMGSGFDFDIRIFEGAGAFVCGEETALIGSIEGKRGFPSLRPPYPAISGLYGCPTLINNVETLSQVSYVINHGARAYAETGTESSKGTKVFALVGKVNHGGLIEVPMGTTLNQLLDEIGGGMEGNAKLKAVQTGGPSGGCIPASLCDTQVDYEALKRLGAIMGSGGLVVLGEDSCMVDVARYFTTFTCDESCGKCTFCRVGIRRMLDILDRLCSGKGKKEDIDMLEQLAVSITKGAMCGLGKTAPNPVLSTLKYFRDEYEEHLQGICRTGTCKDMVKYVVTDDCVGCTKCAKACPSDAIEYTPYKKHEIDVKRCVQCGLCIDECCYQAIKKVPLKTD
jgi:NADH-quinone oxidoreductase subunit F